MTGVLIASWISAALVWWKHGLDSEFADQRLSTALADCRLWLPDLFLFKILRGKKHTHTQCFIVFWLGKKCLFTQGRKQRDLGAAVPLRAATEALSPVGAAAAADGGAASWLAVAVRAEVLEGCCYISPPPHPLRPFLLPSLSFSLALYLSLTISLLLAHIPLNNPHLGQAGWEAIQCSAPLCRLRKETESERQRFSTQEEKKEPWDFDKNRKIPRINWRFSSADIIYLYILFIYLYIYICTHAYRYLYIYTFILVHICICACLFILIFLYVFVCVNIYDI